MRQMLVLLAVLLVVSAAAKFQTSKPTRFKVASGMLGDVITAAPSFVFRLGSGAFVNDYVFELENVSSEQKEQDGAGYRVLQAEFLGRKIGIKENGKTRTNRPVKTLELYEFEGCPFCKKVREAVSILDLDVTVYPCPQGGPTYREFVKTEAGKSQFPYLVDPNYGVKMLESDDIIQYLFSTYGEPGEKVPDSLSNGFGNIIACGLSMAPRMGKGSKYEGDEQTQAKKPVKPLVLYGYEASPFVKLVRERLCALEIPYTLRTCARGSPVRDELFRKRGQFQVPYLEDPNNDNDAVTGLADGLFESSDILAYLDEMYA